MEEKNILIFIVVIGVLLLGFSFYVNVSGMFDGLADPLVGDGLGVICNSEQNCRDFCHDNMGRCDNYCRENPSNELCSLLLGNKNFDNRELPPKLDKAEATDKRPVLKNFGIKIESWDKKTNLAGDFLFVNKKYVDDKIFTEFAHKIVNDKGEKLLPEIGFNVPVGTKVVSPIDGIITGVKFYEPSQDYILSMKTNESSPWIVGFEHVYNMRIKTGDRISAGQELAEVSPSYGKKEFGNVEIDVWTGGTSIMKYCPYDFLEESLKLVYKEKINQLAKDWEEFIGKDVYKQEDWVSPGCLADKIKEK